MIYAYDEPVQLPVRDLYDTQIMAMAINTAKDMYEKGQLEMKDFAKTYGDFYTPIINDQNWFDLNVTGRLRGALDEIYSLGINPLTNPQARVFLQRVINTMPYGDIAKVRLSADNAREFLKAKQRLWLEGKYNPLYDKYDGPSLSDYTTVGDNGLGIWERLSPTPVLNMSDFSKSYFDNIAPMERRATKDGISYTVSEVTEPMLYDIADRHFNDLVTTPQGQLMYKMYKDLLGSDEAARKAFNDAVVSGNLDRRRYSDNFDLMKDKFENLQLKKQSLALQRLNLALRQQALMAKEAAARGDTGNKGTGLSGISLAQAWYNSAMNLAWSADGITKDITSEGWMNGNNYAQFGNEADKIFHDFGIKQKTPVVPSNFSNMSDSDFIKYVTTKGSELDAKIARRYSLAAYNGGDIPEITKRDFNALKSKYKKYMNAAAVESVIPEVNEEYRKQFSIGMDDESVVLIVGTPLSTNKGVGMIKPAYVDKLYGTDDIISNTAGYRFTHKNTDTKTIRKAISKYGIDNTTIASLGEGYGSLRKNGGHFEVMPRVRITCTDNDGNVKFLRDAYVDISLRSMKTKGGAYLGDYKTTGGVTQSGKMVQTGLPNVTANNQYLNNPGFDLAGSTRTFNITPLQSLRSFNMYPDANNWTSFGAWDTDLTSKRLHAKQSESLGTYLPQSNLIGYDPWEDIEFEDDYIE